FAPIESGREPDRKCFREIFIRVTLRVPIFQMHHVTAAKWARPVSIWRFLTRCLPETSLPFFPTRQLICIHVRVPRLVAPQFHEPFWCFAFDFEHHRALQRAQPVVHEKEWNKNRRDTDWNEPFVADVTPRMKRQALCRKLAVKLLDQRFECYVLKPQTEH